MIFVDPVGIGIEDISPASVKTATIRRLLYSAKSVQPSFSPDRRWEEFAGPTHKRLHTS